MAKGMFGRVRETLFPSRKAPVQATTQASHVRDKLFGGNTRAMAAHYGVAPRTVERWVDGTRTPPQLSKAAEKRWNKENTARAKQGRSPLPRPATAADRLGTDALRAQTTERGRERKAKQMEGLGSVTGSSARVGRAMTFKIGGSDAVRARDVHLDLSGAQLAALARAESEDEVRDIIGQGLADYFNGSPSGYGGFDASDFEWDENDFDLNIR